MSNIRASQIPQEHVKEITQLLQEKKKVKDIVSQTGVNAYHVYKLRSKLSSVGVLQVTKRKRRTVKKAEQTKTMFDTTPAVANNTPVQNTPNTVVKERSYEFNVNGMKITVSGAREVAFTNKSVDIKY